MTWLAYTTHIYSHNTHTGILPSNPLSPSATAASEQRGRDVLHDLACIHHTHILTQYTSGILPSKPLSPSATAASEQRGRDVLHDLVHNRPGQAVPTSGLQAQQLQQWLLRFTQQGRGVDQQVVGEGQRDHSMDARHGSTKQQGCGESQQLDVSDQQACGGSERVENSYQQGMHCQQLGYGTGQNGQIETSQQRKRTKRRKSKEGAAVSQQQGHVLDQPQPLNDQQHVVAQPELQQGQELEQHSQGKGARRIVGQQQEQQGGGTPKHQQQQQQQQQQAKQQHPQGEGASQQCQQEHQQQHQRQRHQQQHQNQQQQQQHNLTASSTGPHQQQQKSVRLHQQQQQQQQRQQQQHLMANSTDPQQQQQKLMRLQLQDVVQALHKSLTLLPPLGNMHGLDFLDRHGALIAREEVRDVGSDMVPSMCGRRYVILNQTRRPQCAEGGT